MYSEGNSTSRDRDGQGYFPSTRRVKLESLRSDLRLIIGHFVQIGSKYLLYLSNNPLNAHDKGLIINELLNPNSNQTQYLHPVELLIDKH